MYAVYCVGVYLVNRAACGIYTTMMVDLKFDLPYLAYCYNLLYTTVKGIALSKYCICKYMTCIFHISSYPDVFFIPMLNSSVYLFIILYRYLFIASTLYPCICMSAIQSMTILCSYNQSQATML